MESPSFVRLIGFQQAALGAGFDLVEEDEGLGARLDQ